MSWYDAGNRPINSTHAQPVGAPSTSTLIAELDSTQLGTVHYTPGHQMNHRVTWLVGASTSAVFKLEHAGSTAEGDILDRAYVWTPSAQSGQYIFNVRLGKDSRLRVRMDSSAATATAFIQSEPLT